MDCSSFVTMLRLGPVRAMSALESSLPRTRLRWFYEYPCSNIPSSGQLTLSSPYRRTVSAVPTFIRLYKLALLARGLSLLVGRRSLFEI